MIFKLHLLSRGHSSTSSDAMIQHTTIEIKPTRNEPVRWLRSPLILGESTNAGRAIDEAEARLNRLASFAQ